MSQWNGNLNLPNYSQHTIIAKRTNDSQTGRATGGIRVFVKNTIQNMIEIYYKSEKSDVLGIKIDTENHKDIIITGYCPPAENSQMQNLQRVEEFYESVYLALEQAKNFEHSNTHIIADFNVRLPGTGDHKTHSSTRETRIKIEKLIKDMKLTNMNVAKQQGKYTYIKRNGTGGSIVDYLLTSNSERIDNFTVRTDHDSGSDHVPLEYVLKLNFKETKSYRKSDYKLNMKKNCTQVLETFFKKQNNRITKALNLLGNIRSKALKSKICSLIGFHQTIEAKAKVSELKRVDYQRIQLQKKLSQ